MTEKSDLILEEMSFGPNASNLYSTTGCKRVGPKVDILLEDTLEFILNEEWLFSKFSYLITTCYLYKFYVHALLWYLQEL